MSSPEVAMITGASAGVGRAAVREFATRGAYLGLIARGADGLEAARSEVEEAGGQALVFPLNVADAEAVEEAAECVERELGIHRNLVGPRVGSHGKAQPVPPIFQPELAGAAISWAAHQKRREVFVGFPTVEAILGNRITPGLLDHYLARTAIERQQTTEPEDPEKRDNLFQPIAGDHGAHRTFDARSKRSDFQFWASGHRRVLSLAAASLGALCLLRKKRASSY